MKAISRPLVLMLLTVFISGCTSSQSQMVLDGVVETQIYSHFSEVAGKITLMPVELGQEIKARDLIAEIDNRDALYSLEQLETMLIKKQAALSELQKGFDPEEIKQAQNNVTLAQQALESSQILRERAQKSYERTRNLFEAGGTSQSARDEAKYQLDLAAIEVTVKQTQLDNARQRLSLLEKGIDKEKITAAQADIEQTESQIQQIKDNLGKYKIAAVSSGTVISKNYLTGNMVAPGYNLVDIASDTGKYLVAYLPEDDLQLVDYGQQVVIKRGEEEYRGTVSFIDMKAQYTPKDMQTAANKNKDSVKIKIRLPEDIPLKVGEKADLYIKK
ncbi:MAG: HlyD family efflux transporter periplasmic adaptor subunit [Syntrophomonadaceae bacterium]|nr:HlyD family efflux transporter periplasmic adaptor subunit [Syntrophomonadaceae bacterium]